MRKIIIAFVMMLCAACVASAANYLTFTAEEDSSSFGIVNAGNNPDVQYSLDDGETWIALAEGDTVVLVHKGDKALLKGVNPEGVSSDGIRSTFKMTGKVAASGSLMSLIDGTGLATEIPGYACFDQLFIGCTSLTKAPELSATTLAGGCYSYMFYGCTNLSEIRASFDEWERGSTSWWVKDVAPTGTFICPKELPLEFGFSSIPIGWTVKNIIDGDTVDVPVNYNYLTFTAEEDSSSFGLVNKNNSPDVWYSLDGGKSWNALEDSALVMLAHKGDTALLRGYNPNGLSRSLQSYSYFTMTGKMAASGSVMSLLDGMGTKTELPEKCSHCFIRLFEGCSSLTQAPTLPATVMKEACYRYMFRLCTNLKQAPELPSTSLATACYGSMFEGCTSLTQIPALPATEMAPSCYSYMFGDCTGLTQIPALPGTTMSKNCYAYMFNRCAGITKVPDLPAESLTSGCYMGMFTACENLSEINVSFRSWVDGTSGWVRNVAPTGTFICPKALPLEYGVDRIPEGWTVKYIDDTVAAETNYLTFTAEEDGSTFGIINEGGNNPDVQYSLDGGETWTALAAGDTITLVHKGDMALLRGDNPEGFSKSRDQYSTFRMTGKVSASGSVMSLIDGTGLSTEIPNGYCFCRLFRNCTSLTQAPELPATSLTIYCYDAMFLGCTNLKQVPTLPATTLANFCYDGMFAGCTSLTQTPELPVTTLASGCYYSMFSDCTGLTQAPALPATTLADSCYMYMFSGCTGLSEIHVSFDNWLDGNNSTAYWVRNVAPTGTFICPKALALEYGEDRIPEGWTVKYVEDLNYLTFTAEEDGSTFGIVNGRNSPNVLYSLDGGKTWTFLAEGDTVRLAHKGDKALLKGNNPHGFSRNYMEYQSSFKMTGKIAASGSVMSLIDGTGLSSEIRGVECFGNLFENCTSLTQAPELPATTLTEDCYYGMFRGCTGLTQAPELPATTLADWCYRAMFEGCTGLIQAPELPATTLVSGCYSEMFRGCTGLTQAPALPATTLAEYCYYEMFRGCTSLSKAPALPATTLAEYCYSDMFSSCTSLTEAPELPATTLANNCYYSMFSGCTSLTKAPDLPAPELPAPVNKNRCYGSMFSNCTNLSEISVAFNVWDDNTFWWVKDVAPTGTFICPKALPLEYGVNRIPEGWTVKYVDEGSGVSSALADNITVWTDDLTVHVCGAEGVVSLYDVSGRIVAASNSTDEERVLCVPAKGAYVVWMNGGSSVVLVR